MRPATFPFAAIAGQPEMKLALLLAAVDWRLGVLLRGDKGSGKTTAARALAALLPSPAPFVNLPIGATEDRLLGGLHLERTLQGDPVLKPGLLAEAHGGVLYVDEVNLLPGYLGDALLDAAATGVHVVEREGMSATHPAEFILLGSMNPEEGSLRPQLLDRFALAVPVTAPLDPAERQQITERRLAFEQDPQRFAAAWSAEQVALQAQVAAARSALPQVHCAGEVLAYIARAVCAHQVRSLRADLAAARAARAYAAWCGDDAVATRHVDVVLPLVLAQRTHPRSSPPLPPSAPPPPASPRPQPEGAGDPLAQQVFAPVGVPAPRLEFQADAAAAVRARAGASHSGGAAVGSRPSPTPVELDLRATLSHSLRERGSLQPGIADLQQRVRSSQPQRRFLFVIDSSGSHAAQQRMRRVKGAIAALLTRSLERGDETAMIAFRGTAATVLLEPTGALAEALAALAYLPTGGRTPLAAALLQAGPYLTPATLLILLTDGRANVGSRDGDPWQEALAIAHDLRCPALVVDTEAADDSFGPCRVLAQAMAAHYITLAELEQLDRLTIDHAALRPQAQGA